MDESVSHPAVGVNEWDPTANNVNEQRETSREKPNPRQGTRSEVLIMDDMHD